MKNYNELVLKIKQDFCLQAGEKIPEWLGNGKTLTLEQLKEILGEFKFPAQLTSSF